MRFVLLGLFAVLAVAHGEAPAGQGFQDVIKDVQDKFEKALTDLRKNLEIPNSKISGDEFVKAVKQRQETLIKDVGDLGKKIDEQIKANPDASAALNNIKTKLKEASDKFKQENPEMSKSVVKVSESIQSTWDQITQEVEKSYKEFTKKGGRQEELEGVVKSIIDKAAATANELQANINKALDKKN